MADAPGKTSSKIAAIVVLIPVLILGWYIAPLFLPMWRWQNLDFEKIAKEKGVPVAELQRQYQVVIRHAPRGEGDPCPWQIMTMDPVWEKTDEEKLLVRATVVSDRTGSPPGSFQLNSGHRRDCYFRATAWRLPPGSCGFNAYRPVLVYAGGSLEKLDISKAEEMHFHATQSNWANDDDEVEDGWTAPAAAAAE
jgi:hypothetical protein